MSGAQVIAPVRAVELMVGPWLWRVTWHPETGVAFGIHEPGLTISPSLISGFAAAETTAQLRALADAVERMRNEAADG